MRNLKGEGMSLVHRLVYKYEFPTVMRYSQIGSERKLIIARDGAQQFEGQTRISLITDTNHWDVKFSSIFNRFDHTGVDHSIFNNDSYHTQPISELRKVRYALNLLDAMKANVEQELQQRQLANSILPAEEVLFVAP
jgi:hypothetical protein